MTMLTSSGLRAGQQAERRLPLRAVAALIGQVRPLLDQVTRRQTGITVAGDLCQAVDPDVAGARQRQARRLQLGAERAGVVAQQQLRSPARELAQTIALAVDQRHRRQRHLLYLTGRGGRRCGIAGGGAHGIQQLFQQQALHRKERRHQRPQARIGRKVPVQARQPIADNAQAGGHHHRARRARGLQPLQRRGGKTGGARVAHQAHAIGVAGGEPGGDARRRAGRAVVDQHHLVVGGGGPQQALQAGDQRDQRVAHRDDHAGGGVRGDRRGRDLAPDVDLEALDLAQPALVEPIDVGAVAGEAAIADRLVVHDDAVGGVGDPGSGHRDLETEVDVLVAVDEALVEAATAEKTAGRMSMQAAVTARSSTAVSAAAAGRR